MSFIKSKSDGLTKLGQKYLQQAIESYVRCVLGAQARTRWAIVGGGAKSLQTQDIFRKLVEDSIAQDDTTIAISNMRQAISDTNVVLNMAISPGIILVPSNMIILKEKMQGWNNVITLATGDMKFGTNLKVNAQPQGTPLKIQDSGTLKNEIKNSIPPVESNGPLKIVQKGGTKMANPSKIENSLLGFEEYVVAGVIVSVVMRYIISFSI